MFSRSLVTLLLTTFLSSRGFAKETKLDAVAAVADDSRQVFAQRDCIWQEAQQLSADGKAGEAIVAGEKVLQLERQLFCQTNAELTGTLEWFSQQYLTQPHMARARERAAELLRVQTTLHGNKGWQTISARWRLDYVQKLAQSEPEKRTKMSAIETEYRQLRAAEQHASAAAKTAELIPLGESVLGSDHPFFANTFGSRAECLLGAQRVVPAESAAARAWEIRMLHTQYLTPDTADAAWLLARSRLSQGKHAEELGPLEFSRDISRGAGQEADAAWMDAWRGDSLSTLKPFISTGDWR